MDRIVVTSVWEALSISFTWCRLLAPSLLSTSSGRSRNTLKRAGVWGAGGPRVVISSERAVVHSGIRRMRSAMARHSCVRIFPLAPAYSVVRGVI